MWLEHWRWPRPNQVDMPTIVERLTVVLAQHGVTPQPIAVRSNDNDVMGCLVDESAEYVTVYLGTPEFGVEVTTMRDHGDTTGYIGFSLEDARGSWEAAYRFFVAVARMLGGEREEIYSETFDPEALRDELCDLVDALATDKLDDAEPASVERLGAAPRDDVACEIAASPSGLVVHVTGAGERFAITVPCAAPPPALV